MRLRLVAARPAATAAPLDAAIEIELDPGWKTYWRTPGDAGIPPRLDFSASENAGGATVDFPAPQRDDDGFTVSNVYRDRVVLPVRFADSRPGEAVKLVLAAHLGVCKEVCLPVNLSVALDLPADAPDDGAADEIAAARAALPGNGRPGVFEVRSLKRVGGDDRAPQFEAVVATDAPESLLFVETPTDWYPASPSATSAAAGEAVYRFSVDRKTATVPLAGATIRLTLAAGDAAATRAFTLGADGTAAPAPQ